jgi:hypothetical protein
MGVSENILSYEVNNSYDGTLLATVSRISATAICATYFLLYFALAPAYGFIYDPRVFFSHLCESSDFFNSIIIICTVTLVSITALIPGFAAILYGLLGIRTKQGMKTVSWGIFGVFVGLINFLIVLKICTPH